jgi:tRNA threonylcarbamoyladenosine biosynthesis protein TsaB
MTLFIRADNPEVLIEISNGQKVATKQWQAGRELSMQVHRVIDDLLIQLNTKHTEISGVVVYEGPGSYTGLRISISVANALGYSLDIPVVATTGQDWKNLGTIELETNNTFTPVSPAYGGQVYTTTPRK